MAGIDDDRDRGPLGFQRGEPAANLIVGNRIGHRRTIGRRCHVGRQEDLVQPVGFEIFGIVVVGIDRLLAAVAGHQNHYLIVWLSQFDQLFEFAGDVARRGAIARSGGLGQNVKLVEAESLLEQILHQGDVVAGAGQMPRRGKMIVGRATDKQRPFARRRPSDRLCGIVVGGRRVADRLRGQGRGSTLCLRSICRGRPANAGRGQQAQRIRR